MFFSLEAGDPRTKFPTNGFSKSRQRNENKQGSSLVKRKYRPPTQLTFSHSFQTVNWIHCYFISFCTGTLIFLTPDTVKTIPILAFTEVINIYSVFTMCQTLYIHYLTDSSQNPTRWVVLLQFYRCRTDSETKWLAQGLINTAHTQK